MASPFLRGPCKSSPHPGGQRNLQSQRFWTQYLAIPDVERHESVMQKGCLRLHVPRISKIRKVLRFVAILPVSVISTPLYACSDSLSLFKYHLRDKKSQFLIKILRWRDIVGIRLHRCWCRIRWMRSGEPPFCRWEVHGCAHRSGWTR